MTESKLSYAHSGRRQLMRYSGSGTVMAKFDIESAYHIIPMHPEDRQLLGIRWRSHLYIDTALPFGLRSAPKVINPLADDLAWGYDGEG